VIKQKSALEIFGTNLTKLAQEVWYWHWI
jgi:hypothetical protein